MSPDNGRPNTQTPWLTPYLIVKNVSESVSFYEKNFGMKVGEVVSSEDGLAVHASLTYQEQLLMLGLAGSYGGTSRPPISSGVESPVTFYLYCKDVDGFYQGAVNQGVESVSPPENAFWGDRFCRLKCLNGYIWAFATCSKNPNQ